MEKKLLAKKIWSKCFQDSSEEVHFYFEHIFQEDNFKYYEEDSTILSSMHENSYEIVRGDSSYRYPYLVGIATLPEHRGKSYMTKLLFQELTRLRKEGIDFCFLTPINPILYRSFGFEYFSALEEYSFPTSTLEGFSRESDLEILEITAENFVEHVSSLIKIYEISMLPYSSSFKRKEEDFQRLYEELSLSNGKCYLFLQSKRAAAYIFMYSEKDRLVLRECLGTNPKAYVGLFFFLKNFREYYPKILLQSPENLHLEFYLPNQNMIEKKSFPFMMGRILSPKSFLQKCKLLAPSIHIFIEDPLLIENTGVYTLNEDVSFTHSWTETCDISIGIRELVPLCFGFLSFQDLLRLGKIKLHSVEQLEILQNLFPKKFNFFHEYW